MGLDYVKELIRGFFSEADKSTFESWTVANFGRSLAEFNMLNYTEKIWGIPCNQIAGEWAAQRIPGMNALSIVTKALNIGGGNGPKSMIDAFYYPRRGINMIYAAMEREVRAHDNPILTETNITRIYHENGLVTSLNYEHEGVTETIPVDNLISSMPITDLVALFDPAPPASVLRAAWQLEYRDQVYVFLIINKPHITKDTWIYFPTTPPTFGRMMEPKNWTADMAPANRSSLFVEYFAFKGDKLWKMPEEKLIQMTVKQLAWMGYLKPEEVLDAHVIYNEKAYPSWDIHFRKRLNKINAYLAQFPNVYTVGRNGRFRYNNQDHSIETGLLAAKSILEEQNYDLEAVGADLEYFESGSLIDLEAEKALRARD
jgi:protoporphyrinogen oxidase